MFFPGVPIAYYGTSCLMLLLHRQHTSSSPFAPYSVSASASASSSSSSSSFFFLSNEGWRTPLSVCVRARTRCYHAVTIYPSTMLLPLLPSGTEQGMAGGQSDNDKRQPLWSHGGYDVGSPLYIWTAALVRARRVRTYQIDVRGGWTLRWCGGWHSPFL